MQLQVLKSPLEVLKLTLIVIFYFFITGHYGLLLALPPGFATVVWPASGIALGFALLKGKRVYPGLWIASFLVNTISRDWHFDPSWIAACIALGSVLQTHAAVSMLRWAKQLPISFIKAKDIIYFFAFVAPVSCFTSASVGIFTLYLSNRIINEEIFINWLTWFFGDTLGVMLFTPIVLLIANRHRAEWKDRGRFLLPSTFLSLIVFLLIFLYASARETEKVETRGRKDASEVALLVETKMVLFERLVLSVSGFYTSNTEVTRDDFNEFVEATSVGLGGFNGISWIPRLEGRDIPAFKKWLLGQGVNDFEIRDLNGKPLSQISPEEVYYPLTYYTRDTLSGFRGINLGLDPTRLSVMKLAEQNLKAYTITNIAYVGNSRSGTGAILIHPILRRVKSRDHAEKENEKEKEKPLGFIYFGFRPQEAFADALTHAAELNLEMQIEDENGEILLSTATAAKALELKKGTDVYQKNIDWQGKQLKLTVVPKQIYFAKNRSWDTWAILAIGLSFCATIQIFILMLTGSHYNVSVQVRERTKELDASRKSLMLARDEAVKASEAKGIFLANMSHEIRTPLNGIIGITKLLAATRLDSKQRAWLEYLEVSNRGLMVLINDILDLSKIEAGALTFRVDPFDARKIINEAIQTLSALAEAKNLAINLTISPDLPNGIEGDAFRIRQVLLNIISNAIKFTEQGSIDINVKSHFHDKLAEWKITVVDTGIGMSPEVLSRIFHVFTQGNDAVQQGARGSGLGLTISRDIVELMGGRLEVSSIDGEGSIFEVTLPLVPTMRSQVERFKAESYFEVDDDRKKNFKVLLVEDNEVNRIVALGLLNEIGLEADVAVDGAEAVRLAHSGDYDIILMDIHMPVMNGLEATHAIRKLPIKDAFIIALTADATSKERDACLAAGMDAFISKPIDYVVLNDLILKRFDSQTAKSFDVRELKKRFRGIEQILISTLESYLETFPKSQIDLQKAIENADRLNAKSLVHDIKGMVVNFPNYNLSHRIQELDLRLVESELTKDLVLDIEALVADLSAANRELKELLDDLLAGTLGDA
ncbi:MAG: response regulator [Proteobacteria bacterium]|nr:MAG: response regulator [Pseudomonadota bacterium]